MVEPQARRVVIRHLRATTVLQHRAAPPATAPRPEAVAVIIVAAVLAVAVLAEEALAAVALVVAAVPAAVVSVEAAVEALVAEAADKISYYYFLIHNS